MTDKERKETPIFSGVLAYFPDAIAEVAKCSLAGQQQHNPDKPLGWDRSKSGNELDSLTRHLMEAGSMDTDGVRHSTKVAWRALANLQKEIEKERELNKPLPFQWITLAVTIEINNYICISNNNNKQNNGKKRKSICRWFHV